VHHIRALAVAEVDWTGTATVGGYVPDHISTVYTIPALGITSLPLVGVGAVEANGR